MTGFGRQNLASKLLAVVAALAMVTTACSNSAIGTTAVADDEATEETIVESEIADDENTANADAADTDEATDEAIEELESEIEEETFDAISVPDMGTTFEIEFDIPTDLVSCLGAAAIGRQGDTTPFTSGLLLLRPTGFASLETRINPAPNPIFGETLETWLTHPEVSVSNQEQSTVSGFSATVTDFILEATEESFTDCGPPGFESCIYFASTPDPNEFTTLVARANSSLRVWEIDQGDEAPLILWSISIEGDEEWLDIVERAVRTIELGDPQPAPEPAGFVVEAGPATFDALGGMSFELPQDAFVAEGTQCVLIQFPVETFESGIVLGRIDQTFGGTVISDEQAYFDAFDGQVIHEETGRTVDLWGATLIEYAVTVTGQNPLTGSCAPLGGDPSRDVAMGLIGEGTEYVANAADGGVYVASWVTVDPENAESWKEVFDQVIASLEVTGG